MIQTAILGLLPDELAPDVARLALRCIADGESPQTNHRAKKAAKPTRQRVHVTPRPTRGSESKRGGGKGSKVVPYVSIRAIYN